MKQVIAITLAFLLAFNPVTTKKSEAVFQLFACPGTSLGSSLAIGNMMVLMAAAMGIITMIMAAKDSKQDVSDEQMETHARASAGYSSASGQWMYMGIAGTVVFAASTLCLATCNGSQPYCWVGEGLGAIYMGVGFGLHVHYKDLAAEEDKKAKDLNVGGGTLKNEVTPQTADIPTGGDLKVDVASNPYENEVTKKLIPPNLKNQIPSFSKYLAKKQPLKDYANDVLGNLKNLSGLDLKPNEVANSMFNDPTLNNATSQLSKLDQYLEQNSKGMNGSQYAFLKGALKDSNDFISAGSKSSKTGKKINLFDSDGSAQSAESSSSEDLVFQGASSKEAALNTNPFEMKEHSIFEQVSQRYINVYGELVGGISRTKEKPSSQYGVNNPFAEGLKENFK